MTAEKTVPADHAPDDASPLRERLRRLDAEIVASRQDRVIRQLADAAVRKEPE